MGSVSTTTIVATLFLYFTSCSAITFKSKTRKPEHTSFEISEGFYFPPENVFAENGTFSSDNTNTTARGPFLTAEDLSKSTLDERCDKGLPISASLQYYGPYAKASTKMDLKLGVEGIFPHLINKMLHFCCNASTVVSYGKIIKTIRKLEGQLNDPQSAYDLTFPITGISEDDMIFKDLQFIPIVQAPRVALLVLDKDMTDQTSQLLMTVTKAWPILVFIIVAATLSGIIIWALDRLKNPDEFPPPFISGTWEGFWWAFVTMTTVGYGDRAPKSLLARIFCIVWILVGIIIIAIFTAIITASLSASIQHHFTVHGSKVGAVSGSEEQRLGVSLNADMSPYESITDINAALLNQTLNGSLIDNYVLTHYSDYVKKHPVRIETTYNHPITYGIVLRENSTKMVKCFRSYVRNHPQEVFEIIAKNLQPLKNPTDAESQEVKASRELFFYREPAFKYVLHVLLGVVGFLLLFGALWELLYRKPKARQLQAQNRENAGPYLALAQMQGGKCDCHEMMLNHQTIQSIKDKSLRIKELIKEYEEFYEKWLSKVRDVEHDDNGHITPNMV